MARYWVTPTARRHIRAAITETRDTWGNAQASAYRKELIAGLQDIANNHQTFNSPHREDLASGTEFLVHLVAHRYIAYREHSNGDIVIAGVFHERMDIPMRLRELQRLTREEIRAIQREVDSTSSSPAVPPSH